ncbi:MAG: hypothetical protein LLG01_16685 [Planctomycetaceae bacterium]|nr:hypothetical protein [Planctomycetaceae bacterium]
MKRRNIISICAIVLAATAGAAVEGCRKSPATRPASQPTTRETADDLIRGLYPFCVKTNGEYYRKMSRDDLASFITDKDTGYYIVQFKESGKREWYTQIQALGAAVISGFQSDDTLLKIDPAKRTQIERLPYVAKVYIFQPLYKLTPGILKLYAEGIPDFPNDSLPGLTGRPPAQHECRPFMVFARANLDGVKSQLEKQGIKATVEHDRLMIDIEKTQLPSVAAIPDVIYIELKPEYTTYGRANTSTTMPATTPAAGECINRLRLKLSCEKKVWSRWEDVALKVEVISEAAQRRVVPVCLCGQIDWPSYVGVRVKAASGQTFVFFIDRPVDIRSLHVHSPLEIKPGATLGRTFTLRSDNVADGDPQTIWNAISASESAEVWAEFPIHPGFYPQAPDPQVQHARDTWRAYFPQMQGIPSTQKQPPEFDNAWPAWAWKGKLISNVVTVKVQPATQEPRRVAFVDATGLSRRQGYSFHGVLIPHSSAALPVIAEAMAVLP